MVDANQIWGVDEAIERIRMLGELKPWWVEEPTHPDDILGHARIRQETGFRIATGEHCHSRLMFKQLFQAKSIDVCQIDSCRVAGVNENIAIILMAAKLAFRSVRMPEVLAYASMYSIFQLSTLFMYLELCKIELLSM